MKFQVRQLAVLLLLFLLLILSQELVEALFFVIVFEADGPSLLLSALLFALLAEGAGHGALQPWHVVQDSKFGWGVFYDRLLTKGNQFTELVLLLLFGCNLDLFLAEVDSEGVLIIVVGVFLALVRLASPLAHIVTLVLVLVARHVRQLELT